MPELHRVVPRVTDERESILRHDALADNANGNEHHQSHNGELQNFFTNMAFAWRYLDTVAPYSYNQSVLSYRHMPVYSPMPYNWSKA